MHQGKEMLQALINEFDKHADYIDGKIERGIEENRKGLFLIRIVDKNGKPVVCDNVRVNQVNHEFKFGAPLFVIDQLESYEKNEAYKNAFKKIFNYAVIPMYHRDVEPESEVYRFGEDSSFIWRRPPIDTVANFCRENNIGMKAHCLVYNSFNPEWFSGMSNRDININIDKYMKAVSERYSEDILDMDVINEMFSIYKNCYKGNGCRDLPITDETDHIQKMFNWAKKYFPFTKLFWNEGSFETFGNDIYKGPRSIYYMMLREAMAAGAQIEGIGMQYHLYATVGTEDDDLDGYKALVNPFRLLDALDCYSDFRLPIHISEISVPSYSNDEGNELLQAELAKRVYSLFFSSKNVQSLIWWNMCDNMAFKTESAFHTGLLREDLTEKPVYKTLDELINKIWHTEAVIATDNSGSAYFTGFFGDYEITFTQNGKTKTEKVSLTKENTGLDNRLLEPRAVIVKAD